jgi:hypothetical protein
MRDFKLPSLRNRNLRPSRMSCDVVDNYRRFGTTYRPNFFLDCLILEDKNAFSRNVGNNLRHVRSQKSKALDENKFTYFVPTA